MKSLIVTNTHNNRGEAVDLSFTEQAYYYSDEQGRCYTINDFVALDTLEHELATKKKNVAQLNKEIAIIERYLANE